MKALSIDARRNWKMGNTCDLRPLGVSHISGRIERFLQDCRKGAPCRGSHRRKRAPDIWTDTLQRFFTVSLSIHFLFLLGQWLWTSWIPSWVRLLLTQCQMFFVSVNNITIYIRKMMKRKVWIRRGRYKKRNYNFMNGRKRVFEIFSECWSSWMRETYRLQVHWLLSLFFAFIFGWTKREIGFVHRQKRWPADTPGRTFEGGTKKNPSFSSDFWPTFGPSLWVFWSWSQVRWLGYLCWMEQGQTTRYPNGSCK